MIDNWKPKAQEPTLLVGPPAQRLASLGSDGQGRHQQVPGIQLPFGLCSLGVSTYTAGLPLLTYPDSPADLLCPEQIVPWFLGISNLVTWNLKLTFCNSYCVRCYGE